MIEWLKKIIVSSFILTTLISIMFSILNFTTYIYDMQNEAGLFPFDGLITASWIFIIIASSLGVIIVLYILLKDFFNKTKNKDKDKIELISDSRDLIIKK